MNYCRLVTLGATNPNVLNVCKGLVHHKFGPSAIKGILSKPWRTTQVQHYWRKKLKRAPYTKPLPFSCADDTDNQVVKVDLSDPRPGFELLEDGEELDEVTKKLISLEFCPKSVVLERMLEDVVVQIQDHPLDVRSLEVEIAKTTVAIRNLVPHCDRFRHDNLSVTVLKNRMNRRNEALGKLLEDDVEKFNWLTEKLKLKYKAPSRFDKVPTKKETRLKVSRDAASLMVKQKTEALKKKLEEEKVKFEKYKEQELDKIELGLKELGIDKMDNLADTLTALGHKDSIPRREKIPTKEQLIKKKRIELLMKKKEELDDIQYKKHNFLNPKQMPLLPNEYFF